MGRHSAPDDDEPVGALVAAPETEAEAAERRGRHSRSEDTADTGPVPGLPMRGEQERAAVQDDRPTERLSLVEIEQAEPAAEAEAAEEAAPESSPEAAAPKATKGSTSTAADLALIRHHPEVRNRVLGAVLAPFVLYAVVLLVAGAAGVTYLLWIWIPLISAGVLAGLVLDRAHKQHGAAEAARAADREAGTGAE
jgi:hypothetical protein